MFNQPFHVFDNHNASLSEGGGLPVVVPGFSETPHGPRGSTDFPHPMRQSVARLPLACPHLARRDGAPHERGTPGGCTQPNISDPQHGQLATPLDGLGLRVDTRLTCPPVTVRSGRDGLDPDEVGGACNRRRSAGSARYASPGRRMDSTACPNGYVRQRPGWSSGFLFKKRDIVRGLQWDDP